MEVMRKQIFIYITIWQQSFYQTGVLFSQAVWYCRHVVRFIALTFVCRERKV